MITAVGRPRIVRWAVRPQVALPVWLVTWYVIHLPAVYDYALRNRSALGIEHLAFIIAGLMFWWPDIVPGSLTQRGRVLYLFIAMVAMMPLSFAIGLIDHPLYDFYRDTPKLWGLSTMGDQRLGGAVTLVAETLVLAIALLIAARGVVREARDVPAARPETR